MSAHGMSTPAGVRLDETIGRACKRLGPGPLREDELREHVFPLFSRVLARPTREIYLANHSLGRPLDQTALDVQRALDAWYAELDDAWSAWLAEMQSFRAATAALVGCSRPDAIVPKSAAGQGLRAVLNAIDHPCPLVVASEGEFDSLDFILRTYELRGRAKIRWVPLRDDPRWPGLRTLDEADYLAAIDAAPRPQLVVMSHVLFASGQVLDDPERIIAAARAAGALSLLDTYHSAGAMPVDFDRLAPDFAVGGSYKYTRGGPGACWLAVHPRHLTDSDSPALRTLDTGWFAKKDTFKYERPARPLLAPRGDAWLESTPAVLPFFQARAGLHLTLAISPARLRAYSLEQQALLALELSAAGVPHRAPAHHGAFLLVPHADAAGLATRLKQRGLNTDARSGHVRLCPDLLTTRDELARAAAILRDVLHA